MSFNTPTSGANLGILMGCEDVVETPDDRWVRHPDLIQTVVTPHLFPFDDQSETYDRRAGLAETHCQKIADAVLSSTDAKPDDCIVEIGAGTGSISKWLAHPPRRYVGFDISRKMLLQFLSRGDGDQGHKLLLQADGRLRWPIGDHQAHIIFSSRAIHLLDSDHVVQEIFRIAHPERGVFLIGRIQRQQESVRVRMQSEMRKRLRMDGYDHRGGEQHRDLLLKSLCLKGAGRFNSIVVAQWPVSHTPAQSIESWQNRVGLAGIHLPLEVKEKILRGLEIWADSTFGGLHQPLESEESYVLDGVRILSSGRTCHYIDGKGIQR